MNVLEALDVIKADANRIATERCCCFVLNCFIVALKLVSMLNVYSVKPLTVLTFDFFEPSNP